MLSIELVKVVGDWLWHNGKIDSMSELGPGWLDGFVVEITKGKMASIGDEVEPIAWYDSPLWMMSALKASWRLAPSSFWILGIWGNLSCSGWYHCHHTCNTGACT
jgi:hypothetical protein